MDFNKERFLNFGKFDFTINKSFYYTMSLTTIFGAVGISTVCFMFSWLIYKHDYSDHTDSALYFANKTGTGVLLSIFLSIMLYIFAGCTFHNLRNKQGRITELTLPASNLEKFSWHLCISVLGGPALCFLALLFADLANAILTLVTYPEALHSITAMLFQNLADITPIQLTVLILSYGFLIFTCYVLGNSIKYKYNIVITYIILQILFVILCFFSLSSAYMLEGSGIHYMDSTGNIIIIVTIVTQTILSVLCLWASYRFYTKAQITSRCNK